MNQKEHAVSRHVAISRHKDINLGLSGRPKNRPEAGSLLQFIELMNKE
jgi:hypothetical protein